MKKSLIILFGIWLILNGIMGGVYVKAAEGDLNLPIERIGDNQKQKEKNVDINLFQEDHYQDLKKQRESKESQDKASLFRELHSKPNLKAKLFKTPLKEMDGKPVQLNDHTKHNYRMIVIGVLILGGILSLWIWWRT